MPTCKFNFTQTNAEGARPLLLVVFTNPKTGSELATYPLLDTGAFFCALPKRYAKILGFSLWKLKRRVFGTGAGKTRAYLATCDISIQVQPEQIPDESQQGNHTCDSFDIIRGVTVAFMPKLKDALIGVHGVLDKYNINVDFPNDEFSLSLPEAT